MVKKERKKEQGKERKKERTQERKKDSDQDITESNFQNARSYQLCFIQIVFV